MHEQPPESSAPFKDFGDYFALFNMIIIVVNVIIFVFVDLSNSSMNTEWMLKCGAMYWPYVLEDHQYYRLITSMFLHFGSSHIFSNMLVLWFIGGTLEQVAGRLKYLSIYFFSGLIAGAVSMGYNMYIDFTPVAAGASGAIFGVVGALLMCVIKSRGKIQELTLKQMVVFIFLTLYAGFADSQVDNAAHLGGFLGGFLLAGIIYRVPKNNKGTQT